MNTPAIHQLLSGFADGDAISHAAMVMRDVFRSWGVPSEIFAEEGHISPSMRHECRTLAEYNGQSGDSVIHHYGIASAAQATYVKSPARRILVYHNITPATFFDGFDDGVAAQLRKAREFLPEIAGKSAACWAVSKFNAGELESLGIKNVRVFPLVFSSTPLDVPPDGPVLDKFKVKLTTWLSVGRIAPNKNLESLIEAFYWYHKTLNPYSRLVIVGSERSCPRYSAMLRMLAGDFDLANVCFEGFASPRGLPSYYRSSDVLVSTSLHEGYCLPLLEAMHLGVPVVAQSVGGIPEALDGAGVQFDGLNSAEIALLIHHLLTKQDVRHHVLDSQNTRMEKIRKRDINSELRNLLAF
jgi:glycosyltransferase involved in cell wall biosynthesis